MTVWQLGNCYFLLGLLSSLVFRAVRDALPNNPVAQERILGASLTALALADVTHILATFFGLPEELRYNPMSWNPVTHGNITFTTFLLSVRLAWFMGIDWLSFGNCFECTTKTSETSCASIYACHRNSSAAEVSLGIIWETLVPVDSPILRHSDSFRLKLSAFDETFYLHLRPNEHLVHPAARINYYKTSADGHTVLSHTTPLLRESVKAYWGEVIPADSSSGRLREDAAGVLPRPSGIAPVFEGAFSVNGVIHHVMTKDNYARNKHHLDPHIALADDDPDSLLVHMARLGRDDHARIFCRVVWWSGSLRKPVVPPTTPWYDPFGLFDNSTLAKRDDVAGGGMGSNFQDYIGQSAGCPSTQKILYIGVAADCEYTTQYGSQDNATQQIINNLNTAGALYKSTFNVSLGIVELQVHDPTCPNRLSIFSGWRGQKGNDGRNRLACYTMRPIIASASAPAIVSGTAVSTAGRTEWLVVSHEIGHNFGAIHDCTDGSWATSARSCKVAPAIDHTSCLADASAARETITLQMCGNGIVEAGEDCDPGLGSNSTCCDVSTCKFLGNAVCDPDSSPCCTAQCSFALATQVCRPSKDASCDIAEVCTGNSSACPADVIVPNGRSCGSNGLACASGTCTSLDAQCQLVSCQDPSNSNQCVVLQSTLIDGSPCGYGGTCYSGSCKAGSVLATIKACNLSVQAFQSQEQRIPSWPNGDGQPTGFNSAAMCAVRQANPVVSLANVPPQSQGGYAATHSRGHSTPTAGRTGRSGGSNHRASKSGSHYAPQFPVEPVRNSRSHWWTSRCITGLLHWDDDIVMFALLSVRSSSVFAPSSDAVFVFHSRVLSLSNDDLCWWIIP
ncbi:Disintegrin and metalloproteinase domain-containing protein B [Grifola frondosa]|uniref:Disintegrin and metalloproteinase domain-containing protein B n=1 Tax=Grifola frondosa TaxID=5627 RepID=A0A1C7MSC5_GRIFR|nr:Disintegrin and metalloproteinase domain-containing protein B [Grifola frondosa]